MLLLLPILIFLLTLRLPEVCRSLRGVRSIAGYYQMGMSVDEILSTLSHLLPSQVHSALAYYFDHQGEIEQDLEESSDTEGAERS